MEEGIEILINDWHLLKAYDPISVTDDGIVICVIDEHPDNDPIVLINDGIITFLLFEIAKRRVSKVSLLESVLWRRNLSSENLTLSSPQRVTVISFILKQLAKKVGSILDTEDGIVICDNDEHSLKALIPISVTDDGIVICVNDEHSDKTEKSSTVSDEGIVICFNDEHCPKAFGPIDVTEEGIIILVNEEHP